MLDVKGVGPKAFQQAAGSLRIFGGSEPLDATPVHPESFEPLRAALARLPEGWRENVGASQVKAAAEAVDMGEATLRVSAVRAFVHSCIRSLVRSFVRFIKCMPVSLAALLTAFLLCLHGPLTDFWE